MIRTEYAFAFGTVEMEYEGDVLYRLRCTPIVKEITPEIVSKPSCPLALVLYHNT